MKEPSEQQILDWLDKAEQIGENWGDDNPTQPKMLRRFQRAGIKVKISDADLLMYVIAFNRGWQRRFQTGHAVEPVR